MHRTLRNLAIAAFALPCTTTMAQQAFGGQPFGLMPHLTGLPAPPVVTVDQPTSGHTRALSLDLLTEAIEHTMPNGDRLWRLSLHAPGAVALGISFDAFEVPYGGLVFLYNEAGQQLGAYMTASLDGAPILRTPRLPGNRITVEYYEPLEVQGEGAIRIGAVHLLDANNGPGRAMTEQEDGAPKGAGCTVTPPPEVDILSIEYQIVIAQDPFCCFDDWDDMCQEAYDLLTGGCPAVPPSTVDTNSQAYLLTILEDPYCCEVEWDAICQTAYEGFGGTTPVECAVVPPAEVDVASAEYLLVIAAYPGCCTTAWTSECTDAYNDLVTPPVPDLDAAITSIVDLPDLVCGEDHIAPRVTIKNNGTTVITSVIVIYGIGGQAPALDVWNGSLLPGQTYNHDLPPYTVPSAENLLTVSSNSPNGLPDQVPDNDTWSKEFFMSFPSENMDLLLTPDNWGSDITWTLHSEAGTLLYSGGPYANNQSGQTMTIPFCLTNGCFTFTINDLFGDGICCSSGQGEYVIVNEEGHVYAQSDGQYGLQNIDEICLSAVSVPEVAGMGALGVYPNPTDGLVTVTLAGLEGPVALQLTDGTGRLVRETMLPQAAPWTTVDLRGLARGVYLLTAMHAQGRVAQRVVLDR
ncbi:MAG: T9SS type A sorting domain-containing protein [Flavobacteriales bacterium]|nr:T9SS type A sorting domain-containing protein [Flavobacteriales bacterium]